MKASLLAGVSLAVVALATGSQAADLGARPVYKAPPMIAPSPWNWTGFYIGANVGFARARSTVDNDPGTFWLAGPIDANKTGVIGGLQAGYNWQISSLVLGIEGDISFASLDRSATVTVPLDTYSSRLSTLGTVRGRIGWAFDRALIYGTGGIAFADLKDQLTSPAGVIFTASPSSSVTGWTAGGGVEYALVDHWTVKAEYLHVGFGNRTAGDSANAGYVFAFRDSLDIGRLGLNYKF